MTPLMTHAEVVQRLLEHAADGTIDPGPQTWREPVEYSRTQVRYDLEMELFKCLPMVYRSLAALAEAADQVA